MKKKYTVFISSTYSDLKEERHVVLDAILKQSNFIPVGMEYFPAADDEQFSIIKKLLDDCDFYVLIIGGKYGSVHPRKKVSYTELEYSYAIEKEIPVFVFVYDSISNLPLDKRDSDADKIAKLEKFRKKALSKRMGRLWSTKESLVCDVITALNNATKAFNRPGWVRGAVDVTDVNSQVDIIEKKFHATTNFYLTTVGKSSCAQLIRDFGLNLVLESLDIAIVGYLKYDDEENPTEDSIQNVFNKIGGICRNKQQEKEKPYIVDVKKIIGYTKKKFRLNYYQGQEIDASINKILYHFYCAGKYKEVADKILLELKAFTDKIDFINYLRNLVEVNGL